MSARKFDLTLDKECFESFLRCLLSVKDQNLRGNPFVLG